MDMRSDSLLLEPSTPVLLTSYIGALLLTSIVTHSLDDGASKKVVAVFD